MAATGSELVTLEQLKTSLENLNAKDIVTGVLPIARGGTNASTQKQAIFNLNGVLSQPVGNAEYTDNGAEDYLNHIISNLSDLGAGKTAILYASVTDQGAGVSPSAIVTRVNTTGYWSVLVFAYSKNLDNTLHAGISYWYTSNDGDSWNKVPIQIENGGTGATTQKAAEYNVVNPSDAEGDANDNSIWCFVNSEASTTQGRLTKRTSAQVWNYIKTKTDAIYAKTSDIPDVPSITVATDAEAKGFLGY